MTDSAEFNRASAAALAAEVVPTPFLEGRYLVADPTRERLPVTDPYTGRTVCVLEAANSQDVQAALQGADEAFKNGLWPRMMARDRARILFRLAEIIDEKRETIALLEALDTGKRLAGTSSWDVPNAAEVFRYYAGLTDKLHGDKFSPIGAYRGETLIEPAGPVAAIMPWNFPFACLAWKIAPALASGCTVVVKSSERASLSIQYFGALAIEAGLPEGVVSILAGRGVTVGSAIVSSPVIRRITFTGSYETAVEIVRSSAPNLPKLTLELGGKSPNVILDDCDIDSAVAGTISAIFDVAGQNCLAGSRTFIHEKIYHEFVAKLVRAAEAIELGDNFDPGTTQGPQIDDAHVRKIDGFVKRAIVDGATVLTGRGTTSHHPRLYTPTLLACSTHEMEINNKEVFGPVGVLFKISDLGEAIRLSNATEFGLAAAIWTRNERAADSFADAVDAGTIWINSYGMIDTTAPWGGRRHSGYGKELGVEGIGEFVERKVIFRKL